MGGTPALRKPQCLSVTRGEVEITPGSKDCAWWLYPPLPSGQQVEAGRAGASVPWAEKTGLASQMDPRGGGFM